MKPDQPANDPEVDDTLPRLLRLPLVLRTTGLGRSTLYKMIADHTFPAPVKVTKRAVAWRDDDVRRWTLARPSAGRGPVR